jgi:ribonuclease BN (tRNA processing enzyme)
MRIRILGCSGGIGGRQFRTTSILVDNDILIDCGTGVADLSIAELAQVDHVFLTHSHMDHIACLPLIGWLWWRYASPFGKGRGRCLDGACRRDDGSR